MAKYLPLPKSLKEANKSLIKSLITASEEVFKGDLFGEVNRPLSESYVTPDGLYGWNSNKELLIYLTDLTGTSNIKTANSVLYKAYAVAPDVVVYKGAEKAPVETNRPDKAALEQFEKENQAKEEKRKEVLKKSKEDVENAIKRKQEIYDEQIKKAKDLDSALKNKKIYYKIEENPNAGTQEIENLKEQAEANPKRFIEDAAKQISVNPSLKNLSEEELKIVSREAAYTSYEVLTGSSPIIQSAIISKFVSDPKLINSVIGKDNQESLKGIADILINQKISQFELSKQFLDFSRIDGIDNPSDVRVVFSNTPQAGFSEFNLSEQITSPYIDSLNQQNFLLDNIKSFGEGEIQSRILLEVGNRLDGYVASLPANSFLAQAYKSEAVQLGLSSIGITQAVPWVAVEGSFVGKIAVGTGYGQVAGLIQGATGINLGVTQAAVTAVAETGVVGGATAGAAAGGAATTAAVTTAATTAATTTAGAAAGAAAGATVGQAVIPIPVVGAAIGTAVGWIGSKVLDKIPWQKIKSWSAAIIGGTAGLIALPFIGIGGALGVGIGATAISSVFGGGLGGLTIANIGAGIGSFFGAIAAAIVGAVGIPILTSFIVFPIAIALILFIINSGAYIVPPSPISQTNGATITSPYIDVSKVAVPTGPFENSELPLTVEYQITIRAKKGALSNVKIVYDCSVMKKNGSIKCPSTTPAIPSGISVPNSISPASSFNFSYKQTYDSNFEDSLITDTITVSADTPEQPSVSAAASAGIKIGNPPDSCPSGWPVAGQWIITQTPGGGFSHSSVEAMDIATSMGTPVRATHSGIANVVYTSGAYSPVYVTVASTCAGKTFTSWYAHLSVVSVKNGQQITMGQSIGATGTGGTGPHLHYEFRGLNMSVPYIPKSIRRGCSDDHGSCGSVP